MTESALKRELAMAEELSGLASDAFPAVRSDVKKTINDFLATLKRDENALKTYVSDFSERLYQKTYKLLLFSNILGMDHAADRLTLADIDASVSGESITFDEAVAFTKGRVSMTKQDFESLSAKLKLRAFTVARLAGVDAITAMKSRIERAVSGGSTHTEFITNAKEDELLQSAGFGESKPWYWENVYRTNVQTAYNAGRAEQFKRNPPEYLEFLGIEDSRQSEICAKRSGTILPYTDPFWKSNWPPLHFQCRSTVRAVYREEAEARGLKSSKKPAGLEMAQSGFGNNPLEADTFWKPTDKMLERAEAAGIDGEILNTARTLDLTDFVRDYVKRYPVVYSSAMGASVQVAPNRAATTGKTQARILAEETESAKFLADNGHSVVLLPESTAPGILNPDTFVDGSRYMELKTTTGVLKKVGDRYKDARKQAGNVFLAVENPSLTVEDVRREIRGELMDLKKRKGSVESHVIWIKIKDSLHSWSSDDLLR